MVYVSDRTIAQDYVGATRRSNRGKRGRITGFRKTFFVRLSHEKASVFLKSPSDGKKKRWLKSPKTLHVTVHRLRKFRRLSRRLDGGPVVVFDSIVFFCLKVPSNGLAESKTAGRTFRPRKNRIRFAPARTERPDASASNGTFPPVPGDHTRRDTSDDVIGRVSQLRVIRRDRVSCAPYTKGTQTPGGGGKRVIAAYSTPEIIVLECRRQIK